jgi:hypothetical protein
MVRLVVHGRRLLDPPMLRQGLVQLDISLAGRARQPHGILAIARHPRRGAGERLLHMTPRRRRSAARAEAAEQPRTHFLAEEVERRPRDDGHAGADDSKVALQAAPQRDVVVVVGGVGHLAEGREIAQPHYAAGGCEEAYEEGCDDSGFAACVFDLQAEEFGDWQEEDDEVEEDVEGAVDVDCGFGDGAFALVLAVPL